MKTENKGSALYHVVEPHENFDQSAKVLFKLIAKSQQEFPNVDRHIYLDIEGHQNEKGDFDHDMLELQTHFVHFIKPYVKSISTPLVKITNKTEQINDIPFTDIEVKQAV